MQPGQSIATQVAPLCGDIVQLVAENPLGDFGVAGQRVGTAETTAAVSVLHLDQFMTGGLDQLARFFPDPGAPFEVTGIVVGDLLAGRQLP